MDYYKEQLEVAKLEKELMIKGLRAKLLEIVNTEDLTNAEQFERIKEALFNADSRVKHYEEQIQKEKSNECI